MGRRRRRHDRFVRWRKVGVWDRLFDAVSKAYEGDVQMVDSSSIRVHQHAANGKKGVRKAPPPGTTLTADAWALARWADHQDPRAVDARGLPIVLKLTPGQAHDGRSAADMLETLGEGDVLLADRAYDSDALRLEMQARGAWANISRCAAASGAPPSARSCIDTATSSNASSASSRTSAPSPLALKSTALITSALPNSAVKIWMRVMIR